MSNRRKSNSQQERWNEAVDSTRVLFPHLCAWWDDDEGFLSLRLLVRDDGTTLAIAKGFAGDGGPIVCFGSGYGAVGALMAIDAAINGGNWREDKPWPGKGK